MPREGDYLESADGLVFAVKGLVHPPNYIIAFPKYFPTRGGTRKAGLKRYAKISSLGGFYSFLRSTHPEYLRYDPAFNDFLSEVPYAKVVRYFSPTRNLDKLLEREVSSLDDVEKDVVNFVQLLKAKSGITRRSIGMSGSVMVGLHTKRSDLDLVIYGVKACRSVYDTLSKLTHEGSGPVKPYSKVDLVKLYRSRALDTPIPLQRFLSVEGRKVLQGKYGDRDYFIRLVKEPAEAGEAYGDSKYSALGFVTLKAEVVDADDSIFTPCLYRVGKVSLMNRVHGNEVKEIVSFRGRFCEQAKNFEKVLVRGKLERVTSRGGEYCRVVVGSRPGDYMVPVENAG